jgi:hypothetical protein
MPFVRVPGARLTAGTPLRPDEDPRAAHCAGRVKGEPPFWEAGTGATWRPPGEYREKPPIERPNNVEFINS